MSLNPWDASFYVDNSQKEIEHYGVKGMKWGRRIKKAADKMSDAIDKAVTKPSKEERQRAEKKISNLSDKEVYNLAAEYSITGAAAANVARNKSQTAHMKSIMELINSKPEYSSADFETKFYLANDIYAKYLEKNKQRFAPYSDRHDSGH